MIWAIRWETKRSLRRLEMDSWMRRTLPPGGADLLRWWAPLLSLRLRNFLGKEFIVGTRRQIQRKRGGEAGESVFERSGASLEDVREVELLEDGPRR